MERRLKGLGRMSQCWLRKEGWGTIDEDGRGEKVALGECWESVQREILEEIQGSIGRLRWVRRFGPCYRVAITHG